jgi:F420-dependent oxidoreductase-like protein
MRFGIFVSETSGRRTTVEELVANVQRAERLGFASAWLPHVPWSLDAMVAAGLLAVTTDRITLGTAVVPTYSRHPLAMAQQSLSVQAASAGRFVLGIGPSHPVVVENHYGLSYERPVAHVRSYLDVLDAAFAGTGNVDVANEHFRVQAPLTVPGATDVPVMLAALAPRMLALCAERTAGTILWMADERAVAEHVVPRLVSAAEAAGRPRPRVLACLPVSLTTDVDAGRERAARAFSVYEHIPTYQRILAAGGEATPADVSVIGDEAAIERRLRAFESAGVDEVIASVFGVGDDRAAGAAATEAFLADLGARW